jgi:hypothetical protein
MSLSKRTIAIIVVVVALVIGAVAFALSSREEMVTVRTGEIVLCTEGEIVSDTTELLKVPASTVGEYSVLTRVETCDLHEKLAALYGDAQAALADGDTDAARAALTELIALDPTYRRAGDQLRDIDAGTTPVADGTSPPPAGGQTPGDVDDEGEVPVGPIMNLTAYIPDELPGFIGQGITADVFVLTREYLPTDPSNPVRALVIVVEQFKDATAAQKSLTDQVKTYYPESAADVSIGGNSGYFGARHSLAVSSFADGAILVLLEGAGDSGTALKSVLVDTAGVVAAR